MKLPSFQFHPFQNLIFSHPLFVAPVVISERMAWDPVIYVAVLQVALMGLKRYIRYLMNCCEPPCWHSCSAEDECEWCDLQESSPVCCQTPAIGLTCPVKCLRMCMMDCHSGFPPGFRVIMQWVGERIQYNLTSSCKTYEIIIRDSIITAM